ncbi:thiosulfate oxidation carrier protein SoxY [Amphritea pacifica]|uniref:Thiosulfate oxidation carrier protein SoxY n=1 Tax=Amphritea pacifica TaxID=2811233 RepID=A0ABS2WCV1_9GAMM|nr:thiosulfate oxidation carrier protein SoxY [Amphritea pacifica]MBN0989539.1 thiosulfate oxidation carrier protein SoxY [Amphritea pacifica]MBN1008354.1 thiosulfate oxidation carrier protein SoxY [Amphritea pacifica]
MLNRRAIVKAIINGGALVGVGALMPRLAMAWNKSAFAAQSQVFAVKLLLGGVPVVSDQVIVKAPAIAADGAMVPVTVKTSLDNVESISLFVEANLHPLVAQFIIPNGTEPSVSTRIRMRESSSITAVVKAGGQLMSASQETKVTNGGCEG